MNCNTCHTGNRQFRLGQKRNTVHGVFTIIRIWNDRRDGAWIDARDELGRIWEMRPNELDRYCDEVAA